MDAMDVVATIVHYRPGSLSVVEEYGANPISSCMLPFDFAQLNFSGRRNIARLLDLMVISDVRWQTSFYSPFTFGLGNKSKVNDIERS